MTDGVEIEVKLRVLDPDAIRILIEEARPALLAGFGAAGAVREAVVLDRYFDTASNVLGGALARARLRESAGETTLTLKRAGVVDRGVTEREELEGPATPALDPQAWPDSGARRALLELAGTEPLVETARLRQHRTIRDVRRDDSLVELSLDRLEALDGETVAGMRWELEAELKRGSRDDLADLGEALLTLEGVGPASESKRTFAVLAVAQHRAGRPLRADEPIAREASALSPSARSER